MPKTVLVIEPAVISRIRLSSILEYGQYSVATFATPEEARGMSKAPDLIIAAMSDASPSSVLHRISAAIDGDNAPILLLDSNPTPFRRLAALRAGARDIMPCEVADTLLLARLRSMIREGEAERECQRRRDAAASFGLAETPSDFDAKANIVVIDPNSALPGLVPALSASMSHNVRNRAASDVLGDASDDLAEAYVLVSGADARVLDALLPELRDRSHSRHAPVLAVCPKGRPEIATRALAFGASDVADETACGEELAFRIDAMLSRKRQRDALRRSDEHSYRLAATDPLTGLYNRRYAEAYLGDLMLRSQASERSFVLMLVDLDHFKQVNDRYGHTAGDTVLCEVSRRLRENVRACDLISRHGGEEFMVILPETRPDEAARTAERLRTAVAGAPIVLGKDRQVQVTASIGVAGGLAPEEYAAAGRRIVGIERPAMQNSTLSLLLEAADSALYRAKEHGRNRVEFSAA